MGLQDLTQPGGQELELVGPGQGGVGVEVDLGQDAVKDQVLELLFVAEVVVEGTGDDPRRAARARMLMAWMPSWAMTANASATTRWRVSWGRRSGSSMGASNQSERDLPSVAGAPDTARARLLGGVLARSATLLLLPVRLLNGVLDR